MKHIFWIPFNRGRFEYVWTDKSRPHPTLDPQWLERRFKMFRRFCYQSILNQTVDDWLCVVCCNPETRAILTPMFARIADERLFVAYDGTEEEKDWVNTMKSNHCHVTTIRLDSDDMYHPKVLENVINSKQTDWAIFKKGYAIRTETKKLQMWYYDVLGSGPFFVHRYQEDYDKDNLIEPSHSKIRSKNPDILSPNLFMVNIHDMNSSTKPNLPNFSGKITNPEKQEILEGFKIDFWGEKI